MTAAIVAAAMAAGAAQKGGELAELVDLVHARKPRTVLEIGTMHGGTLLAWCACAAQDALIVSVDLPGGEWGGGYRDEDMPRLLGYKQPRQQLELLRGDSHAEQMRLQVQAALARHGRDRMDFLFIDGDHTLEGVTRDFEDYRGLVRVGGLIAFHDILPHPQVPRCQVDQLWASIRHEYTTWEFVVDGDERGWGPWGGIGALRWEGGHA